MFAEAVVYSNASAPAYACCLLGYTPMAFNDSPPATLACTCGSFDVARHSCLHCEVRMHAESAAAAVPGETLCCAMQQRQRLSCKDRDCQAARREGLWKQGCWGHFRQFGLWMPGVQTGYLPWHLLQTAPQVLSAGLHCACDFGTVAGSSARPGRPQRRQGDTLGWDAGSVQGGWLCCVLLTRRRLARHC